jgi:hypothetical protein
MSLNVTDISNGVSISGSTNPFNTYIKVQNPGVYDIQFSAQVDKTDSGTDEIWIWIRKNGTDISDSATSIQLQGNGAHYVAAWNFFVNAAANDYFQLMWYSTDANIRLHAESAFGVVPGIPSLIVTANRVDQFLSNTGSFSGSFIGSFTGSLFGTSSWAVSASQAISSSYALSSLFTLSSSYALSSSFASTASLAPLYVLNSRTSSFATTGSNTFKDNQIVTGSITSTSEITAAGNVTAQINLKSMYQSGDEGGEIFLNAPATNTTIPNGVTIDVYQNRLRIFEQGGAANGYYLEMPSGSAGVGTNLKPAGFTGPVTIAGNPPPNTLNFIDGILTSVT